MIKNIAIVIISIGVLGQAGYYIENSVNTGITISQIQSVKAKKTKPVKPTKPKKKSNPTCGGSVCT